VLVNNAGIVNFGPIEEYTHELWDTVIATHLTGVFNGLKIDDLFDGRVGHAQVVPRVEPSVAPGAPAWLFAAFTAGAGSGKRFTLEDPDARRRHRRRPMCRR
jgi:hypothetical protein